MSVPDRVRELGRARPSLWIGIVLLVIAVAGGSWPLGLVAAAILIAVSWARRSAGDGLDKPWAWPPEFRSLAEGMARPIDPTPRRLLPPDEKAAMIAQVATTEEGLQRLMADKPPAWPWALFTSVALQRRNAVLGRLRTVTSGYQPRLGVAPLSGQAYSVAARQAFDVILDTVAQLEQFILSPAFKGAFGDDGDERSADPDAVVGIAHRLMDYHEMFLRQAEICHQTPVASEALTLVRDVGALTLCPLIGYEQFIRTFCDRIGEAQDLLPYTDPDTVIALENVNLSMDIPDGLTERIVAQIKRFNP